LARRHGCHRVLIAGRDALVDGVRTHTRGAMADVVYDSVGHDTFFESLDCLKPRGMMVSFGNASGPPPACAPMELARRGSLFLTRPSLFHYIATRAELDRAARELFHAVARKQVRIHIGQRYPLAEAAQAHRDLEARRTVGSTILVP
ncbi:MAG: zinc-binding dehydrogenase, partial [Gammaproteobacteria bacterium]|nr:zinc-binding dehydrogenase [Gammaproteobacteria bacterium]